MTTLADSLVSTSSRKLSMRMRGDLTVREQRHQGKMFHVVKDPVGLGYFRLREEEYFVLKLLDGNTSLDQIKEAFEKKFAPQQLTLKQLQFFIGQLHRNGLILSHLEGQGEQLHTRRNEKQRRELMGKLSNVLAIRFKGIDPEQLLTWMHKWLWWIYTPWFLSFCLLLMLSAVTLVTVKFDVFISKLPAFHEFFQAKNAVWLGIILMVTKVIHEFGHGLTCKHFGGECHEIGVMILVMTPCLYCNVSDSWMLPNKWHRIYISIGGMFIELVIASICVFIWWFSKPGFLNYICLSTVFVCSVSTIIFNGNPLLRYDGYYVASDLLEIPNLWQKSRSVLTRTLGRWCLGMKYPPDPFLPEKHHFWFASYAVASNIYRWVVLFSILWFLHKVFEPYRLQILGQMIALVAIFGLVVFPVVKVIKFFWVPGRLSQVKPLRATISFALVMGAIVGVFFIPVPRRVFTSLVVEPQDAASVYVTVPGVIAEVFVRPGQPIQATPQGDQVVTRPLLRLESEELQQAILEARGKVKEQQVRLVALQQSRNAGRAQIETAQETLAAYTQQLNQRLEDQRRLSLVAERSGTVLPPKRRPEPPASESRQPRSWTGTPLDQRNIGAYLEVGTVVGQVGDPNKLVAVLVIDQGDIEYVKVGDQVEIMLEKLPGVRIRGEIAVIAEDPLEAAPEAISAKAGGDLQTRTDQASGTEKPTNTSYVAKVPLDYQDSRILLGTRGEAKIHAGDTTVGGVVYRYLRQTFTFN